MAHNQMHMVDTLILGGGIAGLWLHARLRTLGYNSLLLENRALGCGQTIASQGILHSGLKYALAGQVNDLARSISAMPDRWRGALAGTGDIDLTAARMLAPSQLLMIPRGFMGGLIKVVTQKTLGDGVHDIPPGEWPEALTQSGFKGRLVQMGEPVLDVPALIKALAAPHHDTIRKIDPAAVTYQADGIQIGDHLIRARHVILTAAGSNHTIAAQLGHDHGLKTQKRPLLMGWLRPAPFPLYAHFVGSSDKPVATVTTHTDARGQLVWYLGAQVAERAKDSPDEAVYTAARKAFAKYLPKVDLSGVEWHTHPIDRVEGKSAHEDGWMPDTPVIHSHGAYHYCWPTKLTFAPLLADKMLEKIGAPAQTGDNDTSQWDFLPPAPYAPALWDEET